MGTLVDDPRLNGFEPHDRGHRDTAFLDVEVTRRRSAAVLIAMVDAVDRSDSFRDDGHRNIVCWVVAVLNTTRAEAHSLVGAARLIRDHPSIGDALADGHIGIAQVAELARLHGSDRIRPVLAQMPELIAELVHHASQQPIKQFTIICKRVERNADPDGTLHDHDRAHDERRIASTRRGTAHRIVVDGDALSGAAFDEVLAQYVQAEFDRDWARGRAVHGDQMRAGLMARTDRQRRFDAFMAMIGAAADARQHRCTGRSTTAAPLVIIHTDPDTVESTIRNHGGHGVRPGGVNSHDERIPSDATDAGTSAITALLERRAETSNGAPVSENDLFNALLLGNVQRVIHDPTDGRIIDLGRKRRLFTGAARSAALAEHRTCCHPGCGITGSGLQLDHNTPWAALMGPTDQRNVRITCRHHNKAKEKLGLRTERHPTLRGVYRTFRGDGSEIAPRTSPATIRRRKHPPVPTG